MRTNQPPSDAPTRPLNSRSATEVGVAAYATELAAGIDLAGQVLPRTQQAYVTDLSQFAKYLHTRIAGPTVGNVTADDVIAFCEHLLVQGRQPRTIARKLAALRAFFGFLQKSGIRSDNPAKSVRPPEPAADPPPLSAQQVRALLHLPEADSFTGIRNRAMLELLYGAGLRLDELLALNLSHLDLDGEGLRVQRANGPLPFAPIGEPGTVALRRYLLQRAEALVDREMSEVDVGALFVSARGRRLRPRPLQRVVERYLRILDRAQGGWERERTRRRHGAGTLRSACERHLVEAGADPGLVAMLLGRRSVRVPEQAPSSTAELLARYQSAHPRA